MMMMMMMIIIIIIIIIIIMVVQLCHFTVISKEARKKATTLNTSRLTA